MKKKILLGIAGVLLLIQLFQIDRTNPAVDPLLDLIEITNPPLQVKNVLKAACYDCHSHETRYPWYSVIAPVSWWMKHHIDEARDELNFSKWGTYDLKKSNHKLEEIGEEVDEGNMPLNSYALAHSESKLTKDQRQTLVNWAKSQMKPEEE